MLQKYLGKDRRTSQGAEGLQPPNSGKTIIFWAKAKCLGRRQQPEIIKIFLVLIKRKNEFHSV